MATQKIVLFLCDKFLSVADAVGDPWSSMCVIKPMDLMNKDKHVTVNMF